MTLEEIGEKFGLTRERVRQIKEKTIRRLRHTSRSRFECYYRHFFGYTIQNHTSGTKEFEWTLNLYPTFNQPVTSRKL